MRTYTVRALRPEVAELDVEFVLHGVNGRPRPGSARLGRVDEVGLILPFAVDTTSTKGLLHSGVDYVPPATSVSRVLVADETALPALAGILEQLPAAVHATVFVEVPDARDIRPLPTPGSADITWIAPTGGSRPVVARSPQIRRPAVRRRLRLGGGESSMIKSVRRHLVNTVGIPKAAISFQGYWKRGEAQI